MESAITAIAGLLLAALTLALLMESMPVRQRHASTIRGHKHGWISYALLAASVAWLTYPRLSHGALLAGVMVALAWMEARTMRRLADAA